MKQTASVTDGLVAQLLPYLVHIFQENYQRQVVARAIVVGFAAGAAHWHEALGAEEQLCALCPHLLVEAMTHLTACLTFSDNETVTYSSIARKKRKRSHKDEEVKHEEETHEDQCDKPLQNKSYNLEKLLSNICNSLKQYREGTTPKNRYAFSIVLTKYCEIFKQFLNTDGVRSNISFSK